MQAWQEMAVIAAVVFAALAMVMSILVLVRLGRLTQGAALQAILDRLGGLDEAQVRLERVVREDLREARRESAEGGAQLRHEVLHGMTALSDGVLRQLDAAKAEAKTSAERLADRVAASLRDFGQGSREQMGQLFEIQKAQHQDFAGRLTALSEGNAKAGEALKQGVEAQLAALRAENDEKLEKMRATVDEKLQGTLEQRLGASFQMVSERLEAVHKGLGEMQSLASGVGDLKRVLTNVKSRGSWGEVQLGALLEQVLAPKQYAANASTSDEGGGRVEYAIRLPEEVLRPSDAKFPIEDYERLQAASDVADLPGVAEAGKALETRIRLCARDIRDKYINPPRTTDFAIMFLPTEGLYAEVIRRPGLCDDIQRDCRIVVAGPTVLIAILNALQMGFRTLAIQERSSEVWQVLGAVKTEFGKFGPVLDKVKKKLQEASNTIEDAGRRRRVLEGRLRDVEALPDREVAGVLGPIVAEGDEADETAEIRAAE
ncbi:DNA recombination protein RmuC [soil metagenome]